MSKLLEMLHDFYCREMEMWAATDVDGVFFMDDWGTQKALHRKTAEADWSGSAGRYA